MFITVSRYRIHPHEYKPLILIQEIFPVLVFERQRFPVTLDREGRRVLPHNAGPLLSKKGLAGTITVRFHNHGIRIAPLVRRKVVFPFGRCTGGIRRTEVLAGRLDMQPPEYIQQGRISPAAVQGFQLQRCKLHVVTVHRDGSRLALDVNVFHRVRLTYRHDTQKRCHHHSSIGLVFVAITLNVLALAASV